MVQMAPLPVSMPQFAAEEPCVGAWQRATLRGNRALARGDAAAALLQYRAALSLADTLPGRAVDADAAVAALVVRTTTWPSCTSAPVGSTRRPRTSARHTCCCMKWGWMSRWSRAGARPPGATAA